MAPATPMTAPIMMVPAIMMASVVMTSIVMATAMMMIVPIPVFILVVKPEAIVKTRSIPDFHVFLGVVIIIHVNGRP